MNKKRGKERVWVYLSNVNHKATLKKFWKLEEIMGRKRGSTVNFSPNSEGEISQNERMDEDLNFDISPKLHSSKQHCPL